MGKGNSSEKRTRPPRSGGFAACAARPPRGSGVASRSTSHATFGSTEFQEVGREKALGRSLWHRGTDDTRTHTKVLRKWAAGVPARVRYLRPSSRSVRPVRSASLL